jgi:ferredoxin-NADP reductase
VPLFTFPIASVRKSTPTTRILRLGLGDTAFSFRAGQAAMLGAGGQPLQRPYSIASSPEETSECKHLEFLVKVDANGHAGSHLGGLRRGLPVNVDGPVGNFRFPSDTTERQVLFIAGGTGIAPLRSMLIHALRVGWSGRLTLIYSARSPQDFAYAAELRKLHRQQKIDLVLTVTRHTGSRWGGHHGRMDRERIAALIEDPAATLCFVCGPPALVAEIPPMLRELGVAAAKIKLEE